MSRGQYMMIFCKIISGRDSPYVGSPFLVQSKINTFFSTFELYYFLGEPTVIDNSSYHRIEVFRHFFKGFALLVYLL
jgi:hypothetical protein